MTNILIEILSEEIPARFQVQYEDEFKAGILDQLKEKNFGYVDACVYSTPRRIALMIGCVDQYSKKSIIELKGPKENAPQQAFDGFLNKNNLSMSDLVLDGGVYYFRQEQDTINIKDVICDIVGNALTKIKWKKSMKFNHGNFRFARPINNALICFDDELLNGDIHIFDFSIKLNDKGTYGHRFLGKDGINNDVIAVNFDNYINIMEQNCVIVSRNKRKDEIVNQIKLAEKQHNIKLIEDNNLMEEVVGLVEYPQVLVSKIDDKFLRLPKEVIQYTMKEHQKFFSFENENDIAPYFGLVSNLKQNDINNNLVIDGNKKVLRARLSDAMFFFDNDVETSFSVSNEKLLSVIFHKKIGSIKLLNNMAGEILNKIFDENNHEYKNLVAAKVALKYAKVDLVSNIVNELPYLQGKMGGYYSGTNVRMNEILENEKNNPYFEYISQNYKNISFAIANHYKPLGPSDDVPNNKIYAFCAIADKIATLCALWLVGEKPTGSKDPFAIRRFTLGIIRIINENGLDEINIFDLINNAFETISNFDGFISKGEKLETSDGLIEFFVDRIKNDLKALNIEISSDEITNILKNSSGSITKLYKNVS